MLVVAPGTDFHLNVQFTDLNGEVTAADLGSVTLTMARNDGIPMAGYDKQPIAVATGATNFNLTIPGADNTPINVNEFRFLDIEYLVLGAYRSLRRFYMLKAVVNIPVSPDDVRAVLGVDSSSLPDSMIGIYAAYEEVKIDTGDTTLDDVIINGTEELPYLISAITLKAAMNCILSIRNSMFQSEQADNTLYRRFEAVDFDSMFDTLAGRYAAVLALLTGNTDAGNYTLALTTTETDAITGE